MLKATLNVQNVITTNRKIKKLESLLSSIRAEKEYSEEQRKRGIEYAKGLEDHILKLSSERDELKREVEYLKREYENKAH